MTELLFQGFPNSCQGFRIELDGVTATIEVNIYLQSFERQSILTRANRTIPV